MSSLAGSVSRGPRAWSLPLSRVSAGAVLTLAVAGVLAATAFTADGGLRLERTTWTEVGLILLGAGLVAAALLARRVDGRLYGGVMLLGFAALTVFTALSVIWSVSPADSWIEANRTLAYLAVLAGAVALARLTPERWPSVLHGVALGCVLVCVWALLTKVFPGALAPEETYARLREPFGYWNAVGLMAALGVPPVLWLAARRSGRPAVSALAWPALGLLFTCLMLSYSRGALLALLLGLAYWFAVVPLRLRGAVPLVVAAAASAPVIGWAFARDALSADHIPVAARADAGHELGALLLLMALALLAAGLAVGFLTDQRPAPPRVRRNVSRALVAILVCAPLAVVGAVALAPGGLKGQTSKAWDQLTSRTASTPSNTPNRLTATSSVRARYWGEAVDVFDASPAVGAGAGGFVVARTRYRTDKLAVRHAHGYAVQTLADLGLIGLALSLVATVGWAVAALRVTGIPRRDRRLPFDPERIGMITMTTIVLIFGIHSLIDWTWFVPANAAVALLCAGWVAARPPLRKRLSTSRTAAAACACLAGPSRWRSASSGSGSSRVGPRCSRCAPRTQRIRRSTRCRSATTASPRGTRAPRSAATRCRSSRCGCSPSSPMPAATAAPPARRWSERRASSPRTPRRGGGWAATGSRCSRSRRRRSTRSRSRTSSIPRPLRSASDVLEASRALKAQG